MRTRLIDIAHSLHLDVSTVSRGLRGDPRVHPSTQALIRKEADRFGFFPNQTAKALVTGKTNIIWLLLPSIRSKVEQEPALYASLELMKQGYDLHIISHHDDNKVMSKLVQQLVHGSADGAIVIPGNSLDPSHYELLKGKKVPHLFLDRYPEDSGSPVITTDNFHGVEILVNKLVEKGMRQAVVAFSEKNSVEKERRSAAVQALQQREIPFVLSDFDRRSIANYQSNLKTGFLLSSQNDLPRLEGQGHPMPGQTLVGVFDQWIGKKDPYAFIVVAVQDFERLAVLAVQKLLWLINGREEMKGNIIRVPCSRWDEHD